MHQVKIDSSVLSSLVSARPISHHTAAELFPGIDVDLILGDVRLYLVDLGGGGVGRLVSHHGSGEAEVWEVWEAGAPGCWCRLNERRPQVLRSVVWRWIVTPQRSALEAVDGSMASYEFRSDQAWIVDAVDAEGAAAAWLEAITDDGRDPLGKDGPRRVAVVPMAATATGPVTSIGEDRKYRADAFDALWDMSLGVVVDLPGRN